MKKNKKGLVCSQPLNFPIQTGKLVKEYAHYTSNSLYYQYKYLQCDSSKFNTVCSALIDAIYAWGSAFGQALPNKSSLVGNKPIILVKNNYNILGEEK